MWPNHLYQTETNLVMQESHLSIGVPYRKRAYHAYELNSTNFSSYSQEGHHFPTEIDPKSGWLQGKQNITVKNIPYGLPLGSNEYFTYFLVSI